MKVTFTVFRQEIYIKFKFKYSFLSPGLIPGFQVRDEGLPDLINLYKSVLQKKHNAFQVHSVYFSSFDHEGFFSLLLQVFNSFESKISEIAQQA